MRKIVILALGVTLALAAAAGIILATTSSMGDQVGHVVASASASAEAAAHRKTIEACHRQVLAQLKSPGTASWVGDRIGVDDEGYDTVTGSVGGASFLFPDLTRRSPAPLA